MAEISISVEKKILGVTAAYYRGSSAYAVFETLEKHPCKRRSDLVLNGQMRVLK